MVARAFCGNCPVELAYLGALLIWASLRKGKELKRRYWFSWFLCFLSLVIGGIVVLWMRHRIGGDVPGEDQSIVLSKPFLTVHGLKIENGIAYDEAAIASQSYRKLIVPENATVTRDRKDGPIQMFMKKTLSFYGHPPEPMSIRTARRNMGCAVKSDGQVLILATFGEWKSREGGARIHLVLTVPERIEVQMEKNLSGPGSIGHDEQGGAYLTKPKDVKEGYWYGPATPTEGWRAVPDEPDSTHRAEEKW